MACRHFCAHPKIRWQSLPEWQAAHSETIRDDFPSILFYFIDGTVVPITDSNDYAWRRLNWNNKHGTYAWSFFIVVAPSGQICYLSKAGHGSDHDKTAWDNSTAVKELAEFYGLPPAGLTFAVGGDKAYPNMQVPPFWHKYITKSGEGEAEPNQENLHFEPAIAKFRAVVERTIQKIKVWHILEKEQYLSYNIDRFEQIVFILCNLVNQETFAVKDL